jgi:hypothetical protein
MWRPFGKEATHPLEALEAIEVLEALEGGERIADRHRVAVSAFAFGDPAG